MQYQLCSMSTEIFSLSGCPAARGYRFAAHATQLSFWLRQICVCTQFTWIAAAVLSVVFCILWPVLTIPAGVFSKSYFYFFVIISIIWGLIAAVIAIFLPLWESRDVFARCAEVPSTQLHLLKYIRLIILISARQLVGGRPFSMLWRWQCPAFSPLLAGETTEIILLLTCPDLVDGLGLLMYVMSVRSEAHALSCLQAWYCAVRVDRACHCCEPGTMQLVACKLGDVQ